MTCYVSWSVGELTKALAPQRRASAHCGRGAGVATRAIALGFGMANDDDQARLGVDMVMEAQKSLRNSGLLPPLAADRVYDHNGAVPSTVRHAAAAAGKACRQASSAPAPVGRLRGPSFRRLMSGSILHLYLSLIHI